MAKYYNAKVKTGKLAGSVFAIRNGVTIERAYQPIVANPQSPKQIASRAKMKLMSQLSEVMSPIIAIPKAGIVSSRNLFVKKNYQFSTYDNNRADMDLTKVDVTGGILSLPAVTGSIANLVLSAQMANPVTGFDRVVYGIFLYQDDGTLRFLNAVTALPGDNNRFETTYTLGSSKDTLVVAYGVRLNSERAKVIFSNINIPDGTYVANVIATAALSLNSDVSLSETKAAIVSVQA